MIRLRFCPQQDGCANTGIFIITRPSNGVVPTEHRIGTSGCAGTPRLVVDRLAMNLGSIPVGECRSDTIILRNPGTYPLKLDALRNQEASYRILPQELEAGCTIPPNGSQDLIVRFCPNDSGEFIDDISVIGATGEALARIALWGKGYRLTGDIPAAIDFGPVPMRTCRDTIIVIRNAGHGPLLIKESKFSVWPRQQGFTLVPPILPGQTVLIAPGDSLQLHIRFCPPTLGPASDRLELMTEPDSLRTIVLTGNGRPSRLWLDSTSANAGDILYLTARLDAAWLETMPIGRYSVRLKIEPTALFPIRALAPDGESAPTMDYEDGGEIHIQGENSGKPQPDGSLFRIEFRGLSTGRPTNRVVITEASMTGIGALSAGSEGLVTLFGCDVTYGVGIGPRLAFTRPVRISNGLEATVSYRSPEGSMPVLEVIDLSGRALRSFELQKGTAEEQQIQFALGFLPHGIYMFEIRTQTARAAIPVMITN